jgi:hypothetical protein
MSKKETAVAVAPSAEALAALKNNFPQDPGYNRIQLPRIVFKSQDVTEEVRVNGKKQIKVITEAGTFLFERETDELDDSGKKVWEKEEIGPELEGIIIYQRKQLRMYDETTEEFSSSPIYDEDTEVLPLFCNKAEVAKGTPAELKAMYAYTDDNGKEKSKLEENRVLYVLIKDELYQLSLRGSSMYSYLGYTRKTLVPSVVTLMSSESKVKGSIAWNQMTFTPKVALLEDQIQDVLARQAEIKAAIAEEKSHFSGGAATPGVSREEMKALEAKANQDFQ